MHQKPGFIGVGIMGSGIVKNMRQAGVPVFFTARENERARAYAATASGQGAVEVADFAALAEACEVIMLCVPDSNVVESLLRDATGIGPHLRSGQIVVDFSTSYPASTQSLSKELGERGITLLDAPLTGSKVQAETGELNVICGGDKAAFERLTPIFETISANLFHVGPSGSGHAIKLINNYLGQAILASICESVSFAGKFGLDLQSVFDAVSVSGGNSPFFQAFVPRMINRDFTVNFQQKFARKDIRYVNNLFRESGAPAPLAAALLSIHDMATGRGFGEEDVGALLKFYEEFQ
jgi:3-hydroxyisobutyrate dehydrogenase-like beta-hydroxyacid dehydrogenase